MSARRAVRSKNKNYFDIKAKTKQELRNKKDHQTETVGQYLMSSPVSHPKFYRALLVEYAQEHQNSKHQATRLNSLVTKQLLIQQTT